MRIPILSHLILLLSRSPHTAFERAMLMQRLRARRVVISAALASLAIVAMAGATAHWFQQKELECLALNVYFEARGEPVEGQEAVAHVVMNRAADPRFPSNICEVVQQGGKERIDCQFSWWCDHLDDRPTHMADWRLAQDIARRVYSGETPDPTGGAMWYHATYVKAYWRGGFKKGPVIGRHIFYLEKSDRPYMTPGQRKFG